jgi:hypothetical protein
MTDAKVHGNTKKAADIALAKRLISRSSYDAILRGELSLADGKALGRGRGPGTPEGHSGSEEATENPRRAREPRGRKCLCGCGGETRGGRFLPGHDHRLYGELKRNLEKDPLLRNERFTEDQRRYAVDRGLAGPEVLPEEERDG